MSIFSVHDYQREAIARFFKHLKREPPDVSKELETLAIRTAMQVHSLEAERQQTRMRPVEYRVKMHELLCSALQDAIRQQEQS